MHIGVPREIKDHEYRVGLTPHGVRALADAGHKVCVEAGAGARVGFADADYEAAGATVVKGAAGIYAAQLIVKIKELQRSEWPLLQPGSILYCYHHLAPDAELLDAMLDASVSCLAYETVTAADGSLPLLTPMSEIAGRLAPQAGSWALQMANGGSGVLLAGVPGVPPARVTILGAGIVGRNAARIALGMGADVTLLDRAVAPLRAAAGEFGAALKTCIASPENVERHVHAADLVICAVLIPGKSAPRLIRRTDLARMRPGSVIVDVAIDQGGACETSRPTSHTAPVFVEEGIVHYCVPNMPAAVARTATLALTQVTLPYALAVANEGLAGALKRDLHLRNGLNTHAGQVTHEALARDTGRPYVDPVDLLAETRA